VLENKIMRKKIAILLMIVVVNAVPAFALDNFGGVGTCTAETSGGGQNATAMFQEILWTLAGNGG
jgi:hypothetical protein